MARAEVLLGEVQDDVKASQSGYLVVDAGGNIYAFIYSLIDNSLYWMASYDNGFTWTGKNLISSLSSNGDYAVWYDRWTPGDTGNVVHLAYWESTTTDDVFYRSLNISTETLGTQITVFNGASIGANANSCLSITKAIGGNLYIAFDMDGGTETGFYRSTDSGATWAARTDVNEPPGTDYYLLAPGFAADNQDIICIYWDRSASEISRKTYDDSANTWSETSIAGSMTAIANSVSASQFAISVDDANNKIILVAWSNRDTLNADLRFWTIDESSITEGTNVILNSGGNQASCAVSLVNSSGLIYVFYCGKSDGTESDTSSHVYYKTSSDGGTTWGSETKLTTFESTRNYDYLFTCPVMVDTAGNFYAAMEVQLSAPDELVISCAHPASGGGNNMAGSVFGGEVIR